MPDPSPSRPFEYITEVASTLESFGVADHARVIRGTLAQVELAFDQWWNEPLAIPDAAAWGGYSESQLRRLMADVTIPVAPDGHIRRRHVPVRPGHNIPLGVDPAPAGAADWAANVIRRRQLPRAV